MDAFLTSTAIVALAEMGDKTQLLAILLASRFRKPVPIILGILGATLANHFLAALAGQQIASLLDSLTFRYAVAAGFIAMAIWTLFPDRMDDDQTSPVRFGAFLTTLIAFFLVEIGDKTQIATIALGAQFGSVGWVTAGTTLGMMIANIPAVLVGDALVKRIPMRTMNFIAGAMFMALGLWMISQLQGWTEISLF